MSEKYTIEINDFDVKKIEKTSTIEIIGNRESGKSYVCRDILNHMIDIPYGIVISTDEMRDLFYSKNFPNLITHSKFDPSIVEKLIKRQKEIKENEKFKNIDTRALIVIDDCLTDEDLNNKFIRELAYNGKQLNITFILVTQLLKIRPDLRTNFDYVFLLKDDNIANQELMFKHYGHKFSTFSKFKNIYDKIIENFGCLVLCNNYRTDDSKKVFKYKAIN
jgi:hypothetical protein